MQEWDVVGVLAALAALFGLVIAPIVKLTQAITRLTATMENLKQSMEDLTANNQTAHESLWQNARELGTQINDHEARIRVIEET